MRKIVVYELLSLDGVAEDPDTFFADWDDAMDANLAAVIATQDAVILGRRSYDEWARFWPGSDDPAVRDLHQRGREVRRDLDTARPGVGQRDRGRRRAGRVRARPEAAARRRHRRPRQHLGRADPARRRRRRRAPARGRADDRRPRARLLDGLPPIQLEPIRSAASPTGPLLVDYRVTREAARFANRSRVPCAVELTMCSGGSCQAPRERSMFAGR